MSRPAKSLLLILLIALNVMFSFWLGQQAYGWMPVQASEAAKHVDDLFSLLVSLSSFILLTIVGLLGFSLITGRATADDWSDGPAIGGNSLLESLWTIVPVLLVLWLAMLGAKTYQRVDLATPSPVQGATPPPDLVDVTVQQWAWTFHYPASGVSSDELHLRINQPLHLRLRTADVLHGFYIPAFRLKQDIVPMQTMELILTPSRKGHYRLYDSQFSGTYFALMSRDVVVESSQEYQAWIEKLAILPLQIPENPAVAEYFSNSDHTLVSRWPSVVPAEPPPVQLLPTPESPPAASDTLP